MSTHEDDYIKTIWHMMTPEQQKDYTDKKEAQKKIREELIEAFNQGNGERKRFPYREA